jgi:prepilin-type N-terminal cleavage/methylation domain-containing protein
MLAKKALLRLNGYSIIESMVAIAILSISIFMGAQLINSPMVSSTHYDIVDIEHLTDSLSCIARKGLVKGELIVHRPWGVYIVREKPFEGSNSMSVFEFCAVTHLGFKIPVSNELYEINQ